MDSHTERPKTGGLGLLGGLPGDLKEIEHEFEKLTSLESQERACATKISALWASIQSIAAETIVLPKILFQSQYPKVQSAVLTSDGTIVMKEDDEVVPVRLEQFPPSLVKNIVRMGAAELLSDLRAKVSEASEEISSMETLFGEKPVPEKLEIRALTFGNGLQQIHVKAEDKGNGEQAPASRISEGGRVQESEPKSPLGGKTRSSFKYSFKINAGDEKPEEPADVPKISIQAAVQAVAPG